ncbi:flavodoxin [Lederbergia lenta]|uniref:flavodoxin n=1 Tax=Lederbergia lenta TaxID=1467 RepID=UPI00203FCF76|nr:flavodoxin [Lederbergia lenta]MCM3109867.1 flavodoxin [Lederbergia lenta]
MRKAIVCYASFSGNTKEVAEIIDEQLSHYDYRVESYWIGSGVIPDLSKYDTIIIGTFTWGKGATPVDMKDFVADVGFKPNNTYIFGTGDTQFGGGELFCRAADRLAKFYDSTVAPLKIEQSPRGSQEELVKEWIKGVVKFDQEIR